MQWNLPEMVLFSITFQADGRLNSELQIES